MSRFAKRFSKTEDIPTMQEVEARVNAGDLDWLVQQNEKLAKRSNTRLKALENEGFTHTFAYDNAKYYLQEGADFENNGYFSRSKKLDVDQLGEQIIQESKFLKAQTSLVSGEKKRREEIEGALFSGDRPIIEIPENMRVPSDWDGTDEDYFKERFLEFLDADAWKDIKKYIYTENHNVLQEAGEAIARGANVQDLNEAFQHYLDGERDIITIWEDWKNS